MKLYLLADDGQSPYPKIPLLIYDTVTHAMVIKYENIRKVSTVRQFMEAWSRMYLWTMDKIGHEAVKEANPGTGKEEDGKAPEETRATGETEKKETAIIDDGGKDPDFVR